MIQPTQYKLMQYQAQLAIMLDNIHRTYNRQQAKFMYEYAAKYFHLRGKHKLALEYETRAKILNF